ncbi:MAG: UDP-2,3-diacylglucosamine diphosphatase LpxI [Alphaproteobacteria bacterium]|nr:UDP-2,3-diacylglucosamine diphosphatase LpxI [Alphaproteobacteria bacterium]
MAGKLGIIAGGGVLPARAVAACRAEGRPYFILGLEGVTDPETLAGSPHAVARLGAAATVLEHLRANRVEEIVLAGRVPRPSLAALRPDWRGIQLLMRIGLRAAGDDGLLGAVVGELEREGFRVVGIEQVMGSLLIPEGPLGSRLPDAAARIDIDRGREAAQALGRLDIGQAVVVQAGVVLAVEAVEGTDAMLERVRTVRLQESGGVLVKMRKPQQERRVDLPAIGPATVAGAAAAGLAGIAVEAGGALVIDRGEVAAAADAAGLFVVGIAPGP